MLRKLSSLKSISLQLNFHSGPHSKVLENKLFCCNCRAMSNVLLVNSNNDKRTLKKLTMSNTFHLSKNWKSNSLLEKARQTAFNFGIILPEKYTNAQIKTASYHLLKSIYTQVSEQKIYEVAGLEDHYDIWFRLVMLHMWVFFVRFQQEGRDGKLLINTMTKILWFDVEKRIKEIHSEQKKNIRINKQMKNEYYFAYYMFGALDEGILGSDAQLASALWSLFYCENKGIVEAWHVESLLHYVRFTMKRMDNVDMDKLITYAKQFEWFLPAEF